MQPMRVLHVINSAEEGGGARHVEALATRMSRRGFEPTVATAGRGVLVDRLKAAGVALADVPMMRSRLDPRPVLRLRRLMARQRFDLVHLHGTRAGFFGTLALSLVARRPRVVYTVHGLSSSRVAPRWVRAWFAAVERHVARRADRVISVSERDRRDGVEAGLLPPERTSTIPNGIDVSSYRTPFRRRDDASTAEVVTVGRLVPQKGVAVLLEAARTVLAGAPGARFKVIGDGPLRRGLEARAAELGIARRVRFLGTLTDPGPIVAGCDLFVLPSLWEGMPISLLEAMAAGRPVVASSASGSAEVVLDEETGVLVPPGDPALLARAILRMLGDPAAAEAMGRRGADRVRREFSLERMVASTDALYRLLLAEPVRHGIEPREARLSSS